jgi:hypothetical protein
MAASLVIGQASFTAHVTGTNQTRFDVPISIAFDPSGNMWVADSNNNRVLEFTAPFSSDQAAALVLGQASFTAHVTVTNSTGMDYPAVVAVDSSGNVWVSQYYSNRVEEFAKGTGFTNHQAAELVLGQTTFTGSSGTRSQTGLDGPYGLAFDSSGNLWVADTGNSRVLEFVESGFTSTSSSTSVSTSSSSTASPSLVCPGIGTGSLMPTGATFTDTYGNVWVAPSGNQGSGGYWSSYFFAGPANLVPLPMLQGWAGVYGTYNGQKGWVVTFYC